MKLMVAYDGSAAARRAMALARRQAPDLAAEVFLVTVMTSDPEVPARRFANAERDLAEHAEVLFRGNGIACTPHLVVSGASHGEALVMFCREKGIDLAMIGIKRTSKMGKLIFGSTAQYMVLRAPCPVITVTNRFQP